MKLDGNYCGPNWSAGKHQSSVRGSNVKPIGSLDSTCKKHDSKYAHGRLALSSSRSSADREFFNANWRRGIKRSAFAAGVSVQNFMRSFGYDYSGRQSSSFFLKKNMPPTPVFTPPRGRSLKRRATYNSPNGMVVSKSRTPSKVRFAKGSTTSAHVAAIGTVKKSKKRTYKKRKVYRKKRRQSGFIRETVECRKTQTDPRAVYIGHGVSPNTVVRQVLRALMKELFRKHGANIDDFSKVISNNPPYKYRMTYRSNPDTDNLSEIVYNSTNGNTYDQDIAGLWLSIQGGLTDLENPHFYEFSLSKEDATGETDYNLFSSINLEETWFALSFTSVMKMQNLTVGTTGQNEYSDEAITRNPLMYRGYMQSGKRGFTPKVVPGNETGYVGFWPDLVYGHISTPATNNLERYSKKLLPLETLKAAKHGNGVLEPGQIKRDICKSYMKFNFQKFVGVFYDCLSASVTTGSKDRTQGFKGLKSQMLGFEKLVDVGSEANLSIGWELEQTYSIKCWFKPRNYTAPILNINTTALT